MKLGVLMPLVQLILLVPLVWLGELKHLEQVRSSRFTAPASPKKTSRVCWCLSPNTSDNRGRLLNCGGSSRRCLYLTGSIPLNCGTSFMGGLGDSPRMGEAMVWGGGPGRSSCSRMIGVTAVAFETEFLVVVGSPTRPVADTGKL